MITSTRRGKNLGKIYFQTTLSTKFGKNPLLFSKFFKNVHPSFKIYSLFFVFFFLCLCFCFLSCFYIKNNFLNSRLIIEGGQTRGFAPVLIIGARVPELPPRVYAYVIEGIIPEFVFNYAQIIPFRKVSTFENVHIIYSVHHISWKFT